MLSDDGPSIWDIRNCLLSSLDFAEGFARDRPEYAAAVSHFSQDLRRIKNEFMLRCEEGSASSSLPDIVNGLTGARAMALIMAERNPAKREAFTCFVEEFIQAQQQLVREVHPGLNP